MFKPVQCWVILINTFLGGYDNLFLMTLTKLFNDDGRPSLSVYRYEEAIPVLPDDNLI